MKKSHWEYEEYPNTYKLDNFLKKAPRGKVFDFKKIHKTKIPIIVILSERGSKGKTYNVKEFIKSEYDKNKATTLWIRNRVKDIENEQTKFLKKDEIPPNMSNSVIVGSTKRNNLWVCETNENECTEDSAYIKFQALNSAEDEKGSRVIFKHYVYDEFNVGVQHTPRLVDMFMSILHSTENLHSKSEQGNLFMFANNKSINHPLLRAFNINLITKEITTIGRRNPDGSLTPFIMVIVPVSDERYRDMFFKEHRDDWKVMLSDYTGDAVHSYFNESLYDEYNRVYSIARLPQIFNYYELVLSVKYNGETMYLYQLPWSLVMYLKQKRKETLKIDQQFPCEYYCIYTEDLTENGNMFYANKEDKTEGLDPLPQNVRQMMIEIVAKDLIMFEDVGSRQAYFDISK